jgi:RNA polymerase sigma-70 factor, ECF subfamily
MSPSNEEITLLLRRAHQGEAQAEAALIEAVYDELRMIAARHMRRERQGHTLQTTALVNEAYLKLVKQEDVSWQGRSHFFATAATLMRRILVDHARKHLAGKRGAGFDVLPLHEELVFSPERSGPLVDLDEALHRLAEQDPRAGRVVELRFFGGLSMQETAEVMQVSERTVQREWEFGRSWLRKQLEHGSPP